ncbi:hypothetical protein AN1V17_39600 [Vallitalea sediminicola]
MNTLHEAFENKLYKDCICVSDFYESILPSNKILSDFYNFLLSSSTKLCNQYVEFNTLTRPEKNEQIYQLTKSKYVEQFHIKGLEAIVSTATSINYNIIRAMKEEGVYGHIPFYIVVTDPYDPIAPGFDSIGATKYFCANQIVKDILKNRQIPEENIIISGYPISKRFAIANKSYDNEEIYKTLIIDKNKKVIVLNCGSQGNLSNLELLTRYIKSDLDANFIMLCGVNKALYKLAKLESMKSKKSNINIVPFFEHLEKLLAISDVYITKGGANSVYEALSMKVPILIEAVNGLVYQERGVVDLLNKLKVGMIIQNSNQIISKLEIILSDDKQLRILNEYKQINIGDGALNIVESILSDLGKV